ncbi:uncharacterized protein LOC110838448 [Zootermopsis nevadensis]|uniref:Uncharacterized protein n=1 Tax=Zootermopsis nevadensis TaxID=136037 RepID=A0A067QKW2_ZOONE|nr:uncharacterized protein LOC110838448 [Zootermopsis nevadensis]KDR09842.1 hypothetical protein L798_00537 [Zootermopsis nevadensis]
MSAPSMLVHLSVAFVAVVGLPQHDSRSFEGDLSALNNLEAEPKVGSVIPMLDQELQECTEPSSLSRVTRNAAGTSGKHPLCCGNGQSSESEKETPGSYNECVSEITEGAGEGDGHKYKMCATAQCLAKKVGVVDSDGFVLESEFLNIIDKTFSEDNLKAVANELVPGCVAQANETAKAILDKRSDEKKCNLAPTLVYKCVRMGITLNCPADLTDNSEECDTYRKELLELQKSKQKQTSN